MIDNPGRVSWRGVGDSQPLSPGADPASRARNRRVEIIHIRT
jgi:flagellar motor protein MotB